MIVNYRVGWTAMNNHYGIFTKVHFCYALYLPNLLTKGPTMRDPKNPPSGYIETVRDHRRVRRLLSITAP